MFDWAVGGLGSLFGWVGDAAAAVAGWAWEKVTTGIFQWLANGLALEEDLSDLADRLLQLTRRDRRSVE